MNDEMKFSLPILKKLDVYMVLFLFSCFTHLRVVFLYVIDSAVISWLLDIFILTFATAGIASSVKFQKIHIALLLIFISLSYEILTTMIQNLNVIYLMFMYKLILTLLALTAIQKLRINIFEYKRVILSILILHFSLAIFKLVNPNSDLINRATIYGSENAEFLVRATGAFVSPGVLSFFASILAINYFVRAWYLRSRIDFYIFGISLILGVMTLNRGFVLPIFFITCFLLYNLFVTIQLRRLITVVTSIAGLGSIIWLNSSEQILYLFDTFVLRLNIEVLRQAIETRLFGGSGALNVMQEFEFHNTFIPLAIFDETKAIHMVDGISLSNSYVSQLATKGGIFGSAVIIVFVFALIKSFQRFWRAKATYYIAVYAGNTLAFACLLIYSNIENLLFTPVSLVLLYQSYFGLKKQETA